MKATHPKKATPHEVRAYALAQYKKHAGGAWLPEYERAVKAAVRREKKAVAIAKALASAARRALDYLESNGLAPDNLSMDALLSAPHDASDLAAMVHRHQAAFRDIANWPARSSVHRTVVTRHFSFNLPTLFEELASAQRRLESVTPVATRVDPMYFDVMPLPGEPVFVRRASPSELAAVSVLTMDEVDVAAHESVEARFDRERRALAGQRRRIRRRPRGL